MPTSKIFHRRGGTQPSILFLSEAFFVFPRATSKGKSPITQKALLEKEMFGRVPPGILLNKKTRWQPWFGRPWFGRREQWYYYMAWRAICGQAVLHKRKKFGYTFIYYFCWCRVFATITALFLSYAGRFLNKFWIWNFLLVILMEMRK